MQPNLYVLGAPKCGTTSIADWLSGHPDIFMSPVKEPHFYNTDHTNSSIRTRSRYEALFAGAADAPWRGEASSWYLYSQVAVPALLADCPEARFVVCLRQPAEMFRSLHIQHLRVLNEDVTDPEEAWALQPERAQGRAVPPGCAEPQLLQYAAACCLGAQVERLLGHVDRAAVHFVWMDDLRQDSSAVYRDLLAFLGVADDHRTELPARNTAKLPRSTGVAAMLKRLHQAKRMLGIGYLGTGLTTRLKALNETDAKAPPLRESFHAELMDTVFTDDIHRLAAATGRDLSAWLR